MTSLKGKEDVFSSLESAATWLAFEKGKKEGHNLDTWLLWREIRSAFTRLHISKLSWLKVSPCPVTKRVYPVEDTQRRWQKAEKSISHVLVIFFFLSAMSRSYVRPTLLCHVVQWVSYLDKQHGVSTMPKGKLHVTFTSHSPPSNL